MSLLAVKLFVLKGLLAVKLITSVGSCSSKLFVLLGLIAVKLITSGGSCSS